MSKKSSKKIKLKAYLLLACICLIVACFWIEASRRLHEPLPSISPQAITSAPVSLSSVKLDWPLTGQAAVGASGYGVLATSGSQNPVPTASIAKLITALVVLQVKPLAVGSQGPILTMTQNDVNYFDNYSSEDGSAVAVSVGEQISEYQLIEGMLLPSANNMADSLAVWAFGSLPAYAAYANHMIAGLGLTHTHVGSDASGFLPDTTSTASDLVTLGEIAEANPVIANIASQSSADLPIVGPVKNVNWLLGSAGINGLKTGNSNQDSGAFLFSAPYQVANGHVVTIIGAVLQSPTLQKAMDSALPLLTSAQKAFRYSPTLLAGEAVGQYQVPWGGTVTAVTQQDVPSLSWQSTVLNQPVASLSTITAPQSKGAIVGKINYAQDHVNIAGSSPVILSQSITKPSIWWRLFH